MGAVKSKEDAPPAAKRVTRSYARCASSTASQALSIDGIGSLVLDGLDGRSLSTMGAVSSLFLAGARDETRWKRVYRRRYSHDNSAKNPLDSLDVSYMRLFAQRQSCERDVPNHALRLRDLVFMVEVSHGSEIIASETFELKEWPDEGVISVEDVVMNVSSWLYSVGDLKALRARQLPCYDYKWSVLRKSDMMVCVLASGCLPPVRLSQFGPRFNDHGHPSEEVSVSYPVSDVTYSSPVHANGEMTPHVTVSARFCRDDTRAFEDEAALEENDFYTLEDIRIGFALREGNLDTLVEAQWPSAEFSEEAFLSWLMNEKRNSWV